jgi:hypothetical protein
VAAEIIENVGDHSSYQDFDEIPGRLPDTTHEMHSDGSTPGTLWRLPGHDQQL